MSVIDLKDTTLYIKDGGSESVFPSTATIKKVQVKLGEGNLQFTDRQTLNYRKNGGNLDTVSLGDQEPIDVTFDVNWEYLKGESGSPSLREALDGTGFAAAWVSTDEDNCAPSAVNILIERIRDCGGTALVELTFLKDFRFEERSSDLRGATLQISGKCMSMDTVRVDSSPSSFSMSGTPSPDIKGIYRFFGYHTQTDSLADLRVVFRHVDNLAYGITKAASQATGSYYFVIDADYPYLGPDHFISSNAVAGFDEAGFLGQGALSGEMLLL
tara:strand:- start:10250 stop:11062 length:813 start_codon:yes stop_codon:yes gene_type:complete